MTATDDLWQKGFAEAERRIRTVIRQQGLASAIQTCKASLRTGLGPGAPVDQHGMRQALAEFLERHGEKP